MQASLAQAPAGSTELQPLTVTGYTSPAASWAGDVLNFISSLFSSQPQQILIEGPNGPVPAAVNMVPFGFGPVGAVGEAVAPTREGIIDIAEHLATRFDQDIPTQMMYNRLVSAFEEGATLTGVDATFYEHELIENGLMDMGMEATMAHLETLQIQGITYQAGYESLLYSPEAMKLINPGY
jgi:hypothetical protein